MASRKRNSCNGSKQDKTIIPSAACFIHTLTVCVSALLYILFFMLAPPSKSNIDMTTSHSSHPEPPLVHARSTPPSCYHYHPLGINLCYSVLLRSCARNPDAKAVLVASMINQLIMTMMNILLWLQFGQAHSQDDVNHICSACGVDRNLNLDSRFVSVRLQSDWTKFSDPISVASVR